LRIGILIYGSIDQLSGGFLYDKNLSENLIKWGHEVEIISFPWQSYIALLKDNFSNKHKSKLIDLDVDILIQDELNHPSLFILNKRIKNKINYPIISIVHHPLYKEKHPFYLYLFYKWIEKKYFETLDGFVFVSKSTQESVHALVGSNIPFIIANPAGNRLGETFSTKSINERVRNRKLLKILFVGNITERKGLHLIIESLKTIPKKDWEFNIVGNYQSDPIYTRKSEEMINKFHLREKVKFMGILDDAELINQYQQSDILVMPSYIEGFGITYLEGMSFGLPAIGGNQGAAKEIINHKKNGFLVSPGDSKELQKYITKFIKDENMLLEMSMAARKKFDKHITWEESGMKVLSFINRTKELFHIKDTPIGK